MKMKTLVSKYKSEGYKQAGLSDELELWRLID